MKAKPYLHAATHGCAHDGAHDATHDVTHGGVSLRGTGFGMLLAIAIVAALAYSGLLRTTLLREAWLNSRSLIGIMALMQMATAVVSVVRYKMMLAACGVRVSWPDAASGTLVSQGIAQWLPASGGVSEVLRIGLMCGTDTRDREALLPRIAVASFLDRVIGFAAVFALGTAAAFAAVLPSPRIDSNARLYLLVAVVFSVIAAGAIIIPAALLRNGRRALRTGLGRFLPGRVYGLITNMRQCAVNGPGLALPSLLALLLFALLAGILQLSIRAVGGEVSYTAVAVVLPLLTLAALLPVSIGGLGGQQLVSVALLHALGVDAAAVASGSLVNAAVVLGIHSVLAALLAGVSFRQMRYVLQLAYREKAAR